MRIFMLDDEEYRRAVVEEALAGHELTFAHGCQHANKFNPPYNVIFLDHDLGWGAGNGREFLKLIEPKLDKSALYIVHSWNISAAPEMARWLIDRGCNAMTYHFGGPAFNNMLNKIKETRQ